MRVIPSSPSSSMVKLWVATRGKVNSSSISKGMCPLSEVVRQEGVDGNGGGGGGGMVEVDTFTGASCLLATVDNDF